MQRRQMLDPDPYPPKMYTDPNTVLCTYILLHAVGRDGSPVHACRHLNNHHFNRENSVATEGNEKKDNLQKAEKSGRKAKERQRRKLMIEKEN